MEPMSKTKHLRISGPFSDDDLAEFVALLRKIDERNPTGIFRLSIIDEQIMMDDGEALIQKLLPHSLADRVTSFARASYRSESRPDVPASAEAERDGRQRVGAPHQGTIITSTVPLPGRQEFRHNER
jgi:hypothetical protein